MGQNGIGVLEDIAYMYLVKKKKKYFPFYKHRLLLLPDVHRMCNEYISGL